MNIRWILLLSLLALSLAGCSGSPQVSAKQSAVPTALPENPIQLAGTPETTDMPSYPSSPDKFVNLAKQDLASRLKIDLAHITLLKTMEIKSPDISTGCKLGAGQILTQGDQVYGYRIWLDVAGEEYIYHVGLNEQIIFCPKLSQGANNPLLMTPNSSNQDYQNQSP